MYSVDLSEHLRTQLGFIEDSGRGYDTGKIKEAVRIAAALRVLFHDRGRSISLLTHLGKKQAIHLISTIGIGKTIQQHADAGSSFISIPLMLTMQGVKPLLDKGPPPKVLSVYDWWNEIILAQNKEFSRRDVVLSAADQEGGAHVDIALHKETIELKDGVGTFTRTVNGILVSEELVNHHYPLLRQIGYEPLNSPELSALA